MPLPVMGSLYHITSRACCRHLVLDLTICMRAARQEKQSVFEAAVVFMESVLQQVCAAHLRSGRSGDRLPPSAASIVAAGEALLQQVRPRCPR